MHLGGENRTERGKQRLGAVDCVPAAIEAPSNLAKVLIMKRMT
jgi:hypothetical protein